MASNVNMGLKNHSYSGFKGKEKTLAFPCQEMSGVPCIQIDRRNNPKFACNWVKWDVEELLQVV